MSQFHQKMEKTRSSFSLSLFSSLTDSLDFVNKSSKSPRNFGNGGGVGLGIVAAMDDDDSGAEVSSFVSLKKPASHFKEGGFGLLNLDGGTGGVVVVDENDESYTCVISRVGNNVKKSVYYGDKVCNVCDMMVDSGQTCAGLSPVMRVMEVGAEERREFWSRDFLSSCYLCERVLHGMDIFMYRGEKAFCSPECRDTHIGREDFKEKCRSKAQKKQQDCSVTPSSPPLLFFAGVAAA